MTRDVGTDAALIAAGVSSLQLSIPPDGVVFGQGEVADAVYLVQRGRVRVSAVSARGREATFGVFESGSFLGEGCLLGERRRAGSAVAVDLTTVLKIPIEDMERALCSQATLLQTFLIHLLRRNARIEEDLIDQLFNSCEKRLARTLLLLAHFEADGPELSPITNMSQEVLAEMIGTTRSRVSFFMNKFRRLGLIRYDDDIEVRRELVNVLLQD
jgi:CRP-like cAMP-binding protein